MRGAVGARILVTGMSGAGESSLLRVLASRGITTVDTDYGGYVEADGRWNDERIRALLDAHPSIVVSGTVENQGDYYDRFDRVVLLSAPLDILLARVAARTDNPYGQTEEQRNEIRRHVAEVEPLLRRGAHVELDGTRPLTDLADAVERFLHPGPVEVRDAVFPRDLSSVSALLEGYLVQTEREKADHGLVAPSDELPERYARAIEDPESAFRGARVMLASVEGEDCGIIVMTTGVGGSELQRFWTTPPARGRGAGAALLDAALAAASPPVRLSVWEWRRPAIELYRRRGFEVVAPAAAWDSRPGLLCLRRG